MFTIETPTGNKPATPVLSCEITADGAYLFPSSAPISTVSTSGGDVITQTAVWQGSTYRRIKTGLTGNTITDSGWVKQ